MAIPEVRPLFIASMLIATGTISHASDDDQRTLIVRERATASLLDDSFTFRVMKLKGYFVDIMISGERRTLKLGDSFGPAEGACTVTFHEISPETRIARFKTDCR
ncbi:MAG: hypothetical protein P8Q48_09805 [Paracoccaceae bacterium]|jgi:hypothetical protein|nr:hypothetical protein [Paracoccaceae bacterium]MDG1370511.1 hypothetical protein [Paracoccaceae bacterium]